MAYHSMSGPDTEPCLKNQPPKYVKIVKKLTPGLEHTAKPVLEPAPH
jgi:hypothetical protein